MPGFEETLDRLGAFLAYARNEKGQTLIEYALVIVVVVLAIIVAWQSVNLDETINDALVNLNLKLNTPGGLSD